MINDEVYARKSFVLHEEEILNRDLAERFAYIHEVNLWGSEESISGPGSTLEETHVVRENLPTLLEGLGAKSMLDIPCGDYRWMSNIPWEDFDGGFKYIGADIVPALVERNKERWSHHTELFGHEWMTLDLTSDPLPKVDVVFVRDCLVHLSHSNVQKALDNIRRSGAKWLCTTWFRLSETNTDIPDGDWRPLNLMADPFLLTHPDYFIVEMCTEVNGKYLEDKCLGVWKL